MHFRIIVPDVTENCWSYNLEKEMFTMKAVKRKCTKTFYNLQIIFALFIKCFQVNVCSKIITTDIIINYRTGK